MGLPINSKGTLLELEGPRRVPTFFSGRSICQELFCFDPEIELELVMRCIICRPEASQQLQNLVDKLRELNFLRLKFCSGLDTELYPEAN